MTLEEIQSELENMVQHVGCVPVIRHGDDRYFSLRCVKHGWIANIGVGHTPLAKETWADHCLRHGFKGGMIASEPRAASQPAEKKEVSWKRHIP